MIINMVTDKLDEISKPIDVDLNIYNENKRYVLRLTEDDLHKIIKESVNMIIKEKYNKNK